MGSSLFWVVREQRARSPGEKIVFASVLLCYFVLGSMVRPLYRHESTQILDKASRVPYRGLADSDSISTALDISCFDFDSIRSRPYVTRRCISQCHSPDYSIGRKY